MGNQARHFAMHLSCIFRTYDSKSLHLLTSTPVSSLKLLKERIKPSNTKKKDDMLKKQVEMREKRM